MNNIIRTPASRCKILFTSLLLGLSLFAFSQGMPGNGQMPTGSVFGKLIDSATGKGIDAATVELLQLKMDSATRKPKPVRLDMVLADANHSFRLEKIPVFGQYILKISAMGYKPYTTHFSFVDRNAMQQGRTDMSKILAATDKDLGNLKLIVDHELLSNVTVTASATGAQLGIDRKIYNVEGNLNAAGGTATDVLKNVPSVSVDIDGNISVRNSTPQIFVDGRPTTLTLDQIPADQIQTVEVITNPSAKYDASGGMAGILNIVLKKNRRPGYSGNLRAGIDQRGKINAGGNLNIRQGKFNFFGNAMYNQRERHTWGTTERTTTLKNLTTRLDQNDRSINNGTFMFGRAGFDYFLDNRNTITLSGMGVRGTFNNSTNSEILVDTLSSLHNIQAKILRNAAGDFNFRNLGGSAAYVHNFPKNGHQLSADLNYNKSRNWNQSLTTNQNFANASGSQTSTFRQQQDGKGNNERITAQIDYANPITDRSKIETGARLNQSSVLSENIFSFVEPSGRLVPQPLLSSKFNYTDRVLAAYGNFTSKIGDNFGYQAGLRLESSEYNGTVTGGTNNQFKIQYPVSLFPSIFLSQQLKHDQQLQLNYSRRINRPGFFQLFPFIDYTDSLNLSRGNPSLKPEFTNSIELSYAKNFDKSNNLILSAYFKHTNGLITRYQATEPNPVRGDTMLVNTYINANSGYAGGFEAIAKNKITPWWNITSNLNVYTSKINIEDRDITPPAQLWSWFGKINNDFKLPKNFTVQLSGDYNSKRVLAPGGSAGSSGGGRGFMGGNVSGNAQGYSMPKMSVDASVRYEFLKNKAASLTLSVNDIFRTDLNETYTESPIFSQHSVRRADQQFFRLNFAFRFGKFDTSLFKRKNNRSDMEGMDSDMGGMGPR